MSTPLRHRFSPRLWACGVAGALGLGLILADAGAGQAPDVGDPLEDYLRLSQITGDVALPSFLIRPLATRGDREPIRLKGPWGGPELEVGAAPAVTLDPVQVRLRGWWNTRQPFPANDGPVWQGRGLSTSTEVGTAVRWKGLSLTLRPNLVFAQNADFELAPVLAGQSIFGYPWRRIDLPQRFGDSAALRVDPGQSELRVAGLGAIAGVSSRNRWWGPGVQNAIVLSNNAAGIPHVFLGTQGPRRVGIGAVEAFWMWGWLSESGYFDLPTDTDDRFLTGAVVVFTPDGLDGLSLGMTRMHYGAIPEGGRPASDFFLVFQGVSKDSQITPGNPLGNDDKDQMLSLFGRWVLPESGFEVYLEWARNDHSENLHDFLLEPEHSQAYTAGFQKALSSGDDGRLVVRGEITHLEREATFRVRPSPVYYAHHIVTQGYTQRGQIIGAGVGPGGNQQYLGAELYRPWGRGGIFARRRVADNDAYYAWAEANAITYDRHDVSYDLGLQGLVIRGDVELEGGLIYTRQLNRWFFGPKVNNVNLMLGAHWRPGLR